MTLVQGTERLVLCKKLLVNGVQSLSDTELLAMFMDSDTKKHSPIQLAADLLGQLGDLRAVLNVTSNQFKQVCELNSLCYAQLQAIQELCRRSDFIQLKKEAQITDSKQTYAFLKKRMRDYKNETFAALFLDNQHRIITYEELFFGTINTATVHSRPIVERVLQLNAAALILAHNHPSGISDASHQDIAVTTRIRNALELVDARLLDHLVIGDNEVYSIIAESKWVFN
jgi:DNA repair protein RadC